MKSNGKRRLTALGLAVLASALLELPLFVGSAHAIIGRPLTPMSYAGVARRTTRRAVVAGSVMAAPVVAAPVVAAPVVAAPVVAPPVVVAPVAPVARVRVW
jgi:hypothetical protein